MVHYKLNNMKIPPARDSSNRGYFYIVGMYADHSGQGLQGGTFSVWLSTEHAVRLIGYILPANIIYYFGK